MVSNMNNWVLGGLLLGGGIYMLTRETKIERMRRRGKEAAEDTTIKHFVKLLKKNPEISLDNAILDFENAKTAKIEEYAKSKGRTRENYHTSYSKFFEKAKARKN
jgi:hypothetical protein